METGNKIKTKPAVQSLGFNAAAVTMILAAVQIIRMTMAGAASEDLLTYIESNIEAYILQLGVVVSGALAIYGRFRATSQIKGWV